MGAEAPCFLLTSRPPPPCSVTGEGLKPKKNTPLVFFSYMFCFFLREVIFYSGFILKEKHKQKKKSIYLNLLFLFPASMKLHICLKTKEGFFQEPRDRGAFTEPSFCFSALPAASPRTPSPRGLKNMVPERQAWSLFSQPPRE